MINIISHNLEYFYVDETKNYVGNFILNYKIDKLIRSEVVRFFKFYDVSDRIEDNSGVFSKFDKNLESKYRYTNYVNEDYRYTSFMPYGVFKWMDSKIGYKWNVIPIIDYAKYHKFSYIDDSTSVILIGFDFIFEKHGDLVKYKLLSE